MLGQLRASWVMLFDECLGKVIIRFDVVHHYKGELMVTPDPLVSPPNMTLANFCANCKLRTFYMCSRSSITKYTDIELGVSDRLEGSVIHNQSQN